VGLKLLSPCVDVDAVATENRWTALHIAATEGHTAVVQALVVLRCSPDVGTAQGHTALAIAVARGHRDIVRTLLDGQARPCVSDTKKTTPLHLAAVRGDAVSASLLISARAQLEAADGGGYTPLLVACAKENRWPVAELLLNSSAELGVATHGQKLSPLFLVSEWNEVAGSKAVQMLLERNADASAVDVFGSTALHQACRRGAVEVVAALCRGGAPVEAQDNDGHFPLELLCACCAKAPEDQRLVEVALRSILEANPAAACRLDFSDASSLHVLLNLAGVEKTLPLLAVRALLDARADPTIEDESGYTAAHYAARAGKSKEDGTKLLEILRTASESKKDFWQSVDLQKPRGTSNAKYLARRGGHHRIPLEARAAVLNGNFSLPGIAKLIESRCKKIIVLLGAGASTAAGIPDFRSDSGLWAQASTRELFSYEGFFTEPERFWRKTAELFNGRKPTKVHALLAHLEQKGILLRVYTQNIDGLEHAAGVSADRIIECHGTTSRVVCSKNRQHAIDGLTASEVADDVLQGHAAPRCHCGALVRPDIVFFGEPLPPKFHSCSGEDLATCDLLMVVGTALSVYPVAGLVNRVPALTPRLLINREAVGPWKGAEENAENYRDVFFEGECDLGAELLARELSWPL